MVAGVEALLRDAVVIGLSVGGERQEAQHQAAVDGQDLVLAGLNVPERNHFDQPASLLFRQVLGLGGIRFHVIELPMSGV